jgi:hypothetical protein
MAKDHFEANAYQYDWMNISKLATIVNKLAANVIKSFQIHDLRLHATFVAVFAIQPLR